MLDLYADIPYILLVLIFCIHKCRYLHSNMGIYTQIFFVTSLSTYIDICQFYLLLLHYFNRAEIPTSGEAEDSY